MTGKSNDLVFTFVLLFIYLFNIRSQVKKKKNISVDKLGTTFGRVHVGSQNINSIQTRKMKGLKKTMAEKKAGAKRKNIENSDNDNTKKLKTNSDSAD